MQGGKFSIHRIRVARNENKASLEDSQSRLCGGLARERCNAASDDEIFLSRRPL